MLDGYPFTEDAYEGGGESLIAKSIGYGIKNDIPAKFEGNLWRRLDNGNVLSNSFTASRPFESWMETYANDLGGMADNSLVYDNCGGGIGAWYNAINYCYSKDMRLPYLNETDNNSPSGVLPCPTNPYNTKTWSNNGVGSSDHYVWTGANLVDNNHNYYVRCVK